MKGKYFLAIDCGLTDTKVVLFDYSGTEIALAAEKTEVESSGDVSEIDMYGQWEKVCTAIRKLWGITGTRGDEIRGVGVTGHGAGTYPVDHNGVPVRRAITSMDNRAAEYLLDWDKLGISAYERTRHNPWAGQPIPQLLWLKENEKECYERIKWVFSAKNWITYLLTTESCAELTDASNSGCINLQSREYDPFILDTYGIADIEQALPPLRHSTDIVGCVTPQASRSTGLPEEIPVVAGLFDVVSCALGSGVYDEHCYSIIAGTWNINTAIENHLLEAGATTKCSLGADGKSYAYVESSATSAGNLEWFVRNFFKIAGVKKNSDHLYSWINEEVQRRKTDSHSPLFLPFLYASHLAMQTGACFMGLRPEHDVWDMARSLYEGVVFAHCQHLDLLRKTHLMRDSAVLSGGAARSGPWCQMFADITGLSIEVTENTQAGALGVAICTALETGVYSSLEEAVRVMVKKEKKFTPRETERKKYQERYARYLEYVNESRIGL